MKMSKLKWLLLALVIGIPVGYLLVWRVFPVLGEGIDQAVGPTVSGVASGIYSAVNDNPVWQQYDIWISGAVFGILAGLIVWKGRDTIDGIRGVARVRATDQKAVTPMQREPAEPEPQPTAPRVVEQPPQQEQKTA